MDYSENLNLAVFTTTYVMIKKSPIVYISHDFEGDWQFLSAETVPTTEAMLVALGEIIEFDPTVIEVLNMPLNHGAFRKDKNSGWRIVPKN